MNYQLTRIEDSDIFYLSLANQKTVGEVLITGTFNDVLMFANGLKNEAIDLGQGEFKQIVSGLELTDITDAKWFLNILPNNIFQIVRTDGINPYSLPTNGVSFEGTLEAIFNKIIELVNS